MFRRPDFCRCILCEKRLGKVAREGRAPHNRLNKGFPLKVPLHRPNNFHHILESFVQLDRGSVFRIGLSGQEAAIFSMSLL